MKHWLKNIAKKYSSVLSSVYYLIMDNKVRGYKHNVFQKSNLYSKGLRLVFKGINNVVSIGGKDPSSCSHCRINVLGNNNRILIEDGVGLKDLTIYMGGNNNLVHIKHRTMIAGRTELAVMEGKKIVVGEDSLFSANITFRAGDSHYVLDSETRVRLNPSKDIIVGDHVWIGNTVIITKGTSIGNDSVVATGSVLTGKEFPANCAIGGNPAKVIKQGIDWKA